MKTNAMFIVLVLSSLGLPAAFAGDVEIKQTIAPEHISNAGLANRNDGLNSIGGTFGVNFFF